MSNTVEFILRLKDLMSGSMAHANASAQRNLNNTARTVRNLQSRIGDTHSINTMERALRMLERRRSISIDTREISRANRDIDRLRNRMNGLTGGSGGGSMTGSFVKGNLITEGLRMAKDAGVDVYQTGMRSGSLKTAINSTTGGQGKQAVAMTEKISDKYGLNYEASLEGVKTLTGGLKGMNMTLVKQMEIFEGVSTGIAAMKLGAEESKGAMLALGQMASKGTVSAEELRGQLGERIPGAFSIAARAMNVTEAQLGKMMQKGELAAKDFLPRFAAEMKKTFGADALEAAKGPQAAQERFNKAIYKMKEALGVGLQPAIMNLQDNYLTPFANWLSGTAAWIQSNSEWLTPLVIGIASLALGYNLMTIATTIWTGAQAALNFVMTMNPIGLVIGAIVALIALIGYVVHKTSGWGEMWKHVVNGAKFLWQAFAQDAKWRWDTLVDGIMIGLNLIKQGWYEFKNSVGLGDVGQNNAAIAQIKADTERRKGEIKNGLKEVTDLYKKSGAEFIAGANSLKWNKNSRTVSGLSPSAGNGKKGLFANSSDGSAASSEGATHSGPRTITVNINKEMFGSLSINSMNVKEGVGEMEDMIREAVFRVFGSLKSAQ